MHRQLTKRLFRSDSRGFSLLEAIVVVAIMMIVLAISIPNFQVWRAHSRLNADARLVMAVLQRARAEAVKRNEFVTVRFSNVAAVQPHYVAFFDANANRVQDAGENQFISGNLNFANHNAGFTGGVPAAIFNSRGLPSTTAVSSNFIIGNVTLTNALDNYSKGIVVSSSGRIRIP